MGVENNTYQIPNLVLGDTFYEWMNVTNSSIISKLNNMSTYSVTGGDGISANVNTSGLVEIEIASTITKGITFSGNVIFDGTVTTINSTNLTIDDYNLVLGDTDNGTGTADVNIGASGGGGIMLKRVHGPTASILWNGITTGDATLTFNTLNVGCSGAWTTTDYINMTGGVGFKSNDDILRFKSGANATGAGLMVATVATADAPHGGTAVFYDQKSMKIGHMSTASAAITQGVHFDQDGMVRIYDGVNKKYFSTGLTAHGFTFGQCVRLGAGGTCQLAHGNAIEDAEVLGMVSEIINTKEFVVTMQGEVRGEFGNGALGVGGATLSPGTIYFLSGTAGNSGEITNQEPMVAGKIRKPMLLGFGATSGYIFSYIGAKISPEVDTVAPVMRRITMNASGTKQSGSTSITSDSSATGVYHITHGFGTANYSVSVCGVTTGAAFGFVTDKNTNGCTFTICNAAGASIGVANEVILAKDVT